MTATEGWKPIPGFPKYWVDVQGRILSGRRPGHPRLLKNDRLDSDGYPLVTLHDQAGLPYNRTIHRLVAEAFLGPRPEGQQVRHLDGNKLNNVAANLKYGTNSENTIDQVVHGVHHHARKTHCPSGHPYTVENTYRRPKDPSKRTCRTCRRNRQVALWAARKAVSA